MWTIVHFNIKFIFYGIKYNCASKNLYDEGCLVYGLRRHNVSNFSVFNLSY